MPLEDPSAAVGKPEEVEGMLAVVLVDVSVAYGLGDGHDLSGLDDVFGIDEFAHGFARVKGGVMNILRYSQ